MQSKYFWLHNNLVVFAICVLISKCCFAQSSKKSMSQSSQQRAPSSSIQRSNSRSTVTKSPYSRNSATQRQSRRFVNIARRSPQAKGLFASKTFKSLKSNEIKRALLQSGFRIAPGGGSFGKSHIERRLAERAATRGIKSVSDLSRALSQSRPNNTPGGNVLYKVSNDSFVVANRKGELISFVINKDVASKLK
jgi:hypothetical protein